MAKRKTTKSRARKPTADYNGILADMVELLETARHTSARTLNSIMTATYWEIGHRIVELEQGGEDRAGYGNEFVKQLAADLSSRFGRGFAWPNLYRMRRFYLAYSEILSTALTKSETSPVVTP